MPNPFTEALLTRLENRYSIDRLDMSTSTWIMENTQLRKKPFSFAGYDFQRAIVDDMHPSLDVVKVSQVGLTEVQVRKALSFAVRNTGVKIIYTMPNDKMFKRISKTRIQPIIENSPVFNPEGSKFWTRSMDLMQFDQSYLYVTGATEGDATSIDADMVCNDEVDLTDPKMLALFNSRMQNSAWKIHQRFSTPSHVGYGIDRSFGTSDQREYMCRCHACNHWNIPQFDRKFIDIPGLPDHLEDLSQIDLKLIERLDLENAYVMCEQCRGPLDLDNTDLRQWVARFPERSKYAHGYNVSPFVTSRLDVAYIVKQLLEYKGLDYLRGWYNTVIGKAFTDANARLTEAAIRGCLERETPLPIEPDEPCFIGIDVGLICHVLIGKMTPKGLAICQFLTVPADNIEAWAAEFTATHNLIAGAMDRFPYTPTANAVFAASKGKIYPVEYRGQKEINPVRDETEEIVYFQANRTGLIDEVAKRVRKQQLPMFGYERQEHIVIEHFRDMVRDEQPEQEAKWVKLNGNDHYFHAAGFLVFSMRVNSLLENNDDANPRTMIAVLGLDIKTGNEALSGNSKSRPRDGLQIRRPGRR